MEATNKSHLANLIRIAKADEVVSPEEILFIHTLALKLGISGDDFKQIVGDPERTKFVSPSNTKDKLAYFYELLVMMNMDLEVTEEERKISREIGSRFGLNLSKVDAALDYMQVRQKEIIRREEVIELLS